MAFLPPSHRNGVKHLRANVVFLFIFALAAFRGILFLDYGWNATTYVNKILTLASAVLFTYCCLLFHRDQISKSS